MFLNYLLSLLGKEGPRVVDNRRGRVRIFQ
jgi:hypothetical protein